MAKQDGEKTEEKTEEKSDPFDGLTEEQFHELTDGLEADEITDREIEDARRASAGTPVEKVCALTGRSRENLEIIKDRHGPALRRRSTRKNP